MYPTYRAPLAIQFENLSLYIKNEIAHTVKESPRTRTNSEENGNDRVNNLQNACDKLQLWASMLAFRSSSKDSLVGDVLEAIDVSESDLGERLHRVFSGIAAHVSNDDSSRWNRDIDSLDELVPAIRKQYAELRLQRISGPPRQSIVLCLDGGGVTSFSSLLILRALMLRVTEIIKRSAAKDDNLSLQGTSRPRDFFDYIFGSSSGGMIAIMLGRLQMTVDECIESFKAYGEDVFTRARLIHTLQLPFLFLNRPKYGEKSIRRAIEKVVQRHEPDREKQVWKQYTFAASHDQCRTAVIAIASKGKLVRPHLFRTYDHHKPDHPAPFLRNLGDADSAPIWQVARATSAFPYYFNYAIIRDEKYRDGGSGFNNPSLEALAEISDIHRYRPEYIEMARNHKSLAPRKDLAQHLTKEQIEREAEQYKDLGDAIAIFVSIGSGKRPLPGLRSTNALPGLKTLEGIYQNTTWTAWTYTERAHEEIKRATWRTSTAYYRLNAGEGMGNMRIDEWKKRSFGGKHVNVTLELIEQETKRYLEEPETKEDLQSCAEKLVRLRRKQL